jgi:hypothetical protein
MGQQMCLGSRQIIMFRESVDNHESQAADLKGSIAEDRSEETIAPSPSPQEVGNGIPSGLSQLPKTADASPTVLSVFSYGPEQWAQTDIAHPQAATD